ncbi:MAG: HAD family hydrolase [Ktedonobacteraceae bacterium]
MTHIQGVILDVDGTLVDSNDAHAKSWVDALAEFGYTVPFAKIRPLIGKGGDKVLPETIGVQSESDTGQKISQRRGEIFKERYLPTVHAFPQAQALLDHMRACGLKLAIASSAKPDELRSLLQLVGAADLIQEQTSSKDAKSSKPDPDAVQVTLHRMDILPHYVVMGDTPYDIEAAKKVAVRTIAVRSGGWKDANLAGAIAIYTDTAELLAQYGHSPLA